MLMFYISLIDFSEDKEKFEKLYDEYGRLMKYIACDILEDEYLAEDAVHEAFIKLIRYLKKIDDVKCPKTKTFIAILIRSISLDMLKKEKRVKFSNIDDALDSPTENKDFLDNINTTELVLAISSLPNTYRDIIELKAYYELSDREIADILKISSSAARKRLERARKALKECLKGGGENVVFK